MPPSPSRRCGWPGACSSVVPTLYLISSPAGMGGERNQDFEMTKYRKQQNNKINQIKNKMKQNSMIHRSARAAIKLLLAALLPATAQTAWAWSGQGTEADPYKIANDSDVTPVTPEA